MCGKYVVFLMFPWFRLAELLGVTYMSMLCFITVIVHLNTLMKLVFCFLATATELPLVCI